MRYGPDCARERHNELSHGEYLVSSRLIETCREVQLIEIIGAQGNKDENFLRWIVCLRNFVNRTA
jgi:hypothetical protein